MPRACSGWATSVTGLRLAMQDPYQAPQVSRDVAHGARRRTSTSRTGRSDHANFFRSIELTKR